MKAGLINTIFGQFWIPHDDRIVVSVISDKKAWEPAEVYFLRERCFPDGVGTLIDVGAHVGLVSLPVALRHPKVRVFAFEAHPGNFALLEENVKLHGLDGSRIIIQNCAVGDYSGTAEFSISWENTVDHRVVLGSEGGIGAWGEENRQRVMVPMRRLDFLLGLDDLAKPIVLKVDVQGSDLAVLRGLSGIKPDILCLEWWPYGLSRAGETLQSAEFLLNEYAKGAPLIDHLVKLQPGLHLQLIHVLPFDQSSPNYIDLVCER